MKFDRINHILKEEAVALPDGLPNVTIKGITYNSQEVKDGYLFFAIEGYQRDGHDYIQDAVGKGAAAVVGEQGDVEVSVPYIQVADGRRALSVISDYYYGFPAADKTVIGVTGTNGKTTTGHLLKSMFEESGVSCALFGSTGNIVNKEKHPAGNTTPTLLEINRLLAVSDDEVVIVEVSSHALTQHRVEGLVFDYALFTNLTHDHLDYHGSMENYFAAKKKLFRMLTKKGQAVINTQNEWGEKLAGELRKENTSVVSVDAGEDSDVYISEYDDGAGELLLRHNGKEIFLEPSIAGIHNMYNIAMAYGTVKLMGARDEAVARAVTGFKGVEGRFSVHYLSGDRTVAIDYAHTPDALYHSLDTVRSQCTGKFIHLFGFRGDRDEEKREEMITVSARMSDQYILTLDDLNSVSKEEMEKTLYEIQRRYGRGNGEVIPDRTLAIEEALRRSGEKDWVVITGKGEESYQQEYHYPAPTDSETVFYLEKSTTRR
ncbi:UDP-N-acetylmuramoyl-L-alanyl-D-glutamate--2,6-diaminopimelate ligase [Salimicrobium jeotgali]|nr:UDP-N-acetylmuramoyl-L-alanyl-D-glutamate--2,6-diaminopimelate ligase [Salimicrobium jeotgali]